MQYPVPQLNFRVHVEISKSDLPTYQHELVHLVFHRWWWRLCGYAVIGVVTSMCRLLKLDQNQSKLAAFE